MTCAIASLSALYHIESRWVVCLNGILHIVTFHLLLNVAKRKRFFLFVMFVDFSQTYVPSRELLCTACCDD